ncbi:E3 ubiquitin-protein ligase PHF7-like [Haematobia irritans]|uniref:E3 ubiquitin-protein ligase PHF7-like n=1 Tax=Haematobia irritans TaxID=7368 RepID=UPI003F503CE5
MAKHELMEKTCDLCKMTSSTESEDTLHFGEWMTKGDITVHYFCLLLSTNLPQKGEDHGGILGFLLRDIRKEIHFAKRRICMYCQKGSATIMCSNCKKYYHLPCGQTNLCLSEFIGEFKSYCRSCLPLDDIQQKMLTSDVRPSKYNCAICKSFMGAYRPTVWIRSKCCNNGYAHSVCMKKYALNSGYYLKCIWCRSKDFREDVKYQGIFVPDRDANWEREKGAYSELHRSYSRCDMETCHCGKGRDYSKGKWSIIKCVLCGLVGAHNPFCIPGLENNKKPTEEFKCDTCSVTEHTMIKTGNDSRNEMELFDINSTLYVPKSIVNSSVSRDSESTDMSEESETSQITIVNQGLAAYCNSNIDIVVPQLTQCVDTTNDNIPLAFESTKTNVESCIPRIDTSLQNVDEKETENVSSSPFIKFAVDRMMALFDD